MQALFDLLQLKVDYTREFLIFGLILVRTMPIVFLGPFFGGQVTPGEVKMGLGVLFTALLWPTAVDALTGPLPLAMIPYLMLMFKEIFVGLCIGFVSSYIFYAMEIAGRIVDTARGSAMGEVNDPESHHRNTTTGEIFYQLLLVFFVVSGGHHVFLEMYFHSFQVLPLTESPVMDAIAIKPFSDYLMHLTAEIMYIGTILAAPAVAATFITDVVFGILNRVAPQLNAYFMAMPVKAMAGIAMVFVVMDPFLDRLDYFVKISLESVRTTIAMLGAG
jgi:flagellar biosynthetic protein FliR